MSLSPEMVETISIPDGLMYDRNLSRNASSSRAIPVPRLIEDIRRDPAEPLFWGKHQPGMQAAEELDVGAKRLAQSIWRANRETCIRDALALHAIGAHKQLVNRLVEKHGFINVVVTATNWSNFFALRRHKDAQPEIQRLADLVWEAQQASTPKRLALDEWHLPYVDIDEEFEAVTDHLWRRHKAGEFSEGAIDSLSVDILIQISVARCARVSYLTTEGKKPSVDQDVALYQRLVGSLPRHASPAEHQATPDGYSGRTYGGRVSWMHAEQHGNLSGYRQYRKTLPDECS